MKVLISYPQRYNFDLVEPKPLSQRCMHSMLINFDSYRIAAKSIDALLSRVYTHCASHNVKRDHLNSEHVWRYCDIEITDRKRYYMLALAVCAPNGYLTRRLHYLYRGSAIERTESGAWVAYVPYRDLVLSDSLFALVQSLTE
jgi:hypothetical protein